MSKKIFTLLAIVLMMVTVLSVIACTEGDDTPDTETTVESTSEVTSDTETTTEAETTEAETTEAETTEAETTEAETTEPETAVGTGPVPELIETVPDEE